MNVNDLLCGGARSILFLDYLGCSKLNLEIGASFVEGVATGCRLAGCALVGGETAEMPGLYSGEDYDAAGAATGMRSHDQKLPRLEDMAVGDILLGIASDGVHSNGFSLVRKIVARSGIEYTSPAPWDASKSVGESLLTPTRIYVKSIWRVHEHERLLLGLAHITGGGLSENIPRMLPHHLAAEVDVSTWKLPGVFKWLKQEGQVASEEMARAFNTGLGMVAVVKAENAQRVTSELEAAGETVYTVGKLVSRNGEGCVLKNLASWD